VVLVVVGGRVVVVVLDVVDGPVVEGAGAELPHASSVSGSVDPRAFGAFLHLPSLLQPHSGTIGRGRLRASTDPPAGPLCSAGRTGGCGRGTASWPTRLVALAFTLARSVNPSTLEMGRTHTPYAAAWLAEQEGLPALPGARKTGLANAAK
jgi:hypothetical protein